MRIELQILRRISNKTYYRPLRTRLIAALELKLCDQEFRLYDFLVAVYNWREEEELSFKTVEFTERELAPFLKWSDTKVNKYKNLLINKGLLTPIGTHVYKVNDLVPTDEYIQKIKQDYFEKQQNYYKPKHKNPLKKQVKLNNEKNYSSSYKGNESFSIEDIDDIPF